MNEVKARPNPFECIDFLMRHTEINQRKADSRYLQLIDQWLDHLVHSLSGGDVRHEFFRVGLSITKGEISDVAMRNEKNVFALANRIRGAVNILFKMLTMQKGNSFVIEVKDHPSIQAERVVEALDSRMASTTLAVLLAEESVGDLRALSKDPSIKFLNEKEVYQLWDWAALNRDAEVLKNLLEVFWIDPTKICAILDQFGIEAGATELGEFFLPYHLDRLPDSYQKKVSQWLAVQKDSDSNEWETISNESRTNVVEIPYPPSIETFVQPALLHERPHPSFPILADADEANQHVEGENIYLRRFAEAFIQLLAKHGYRPLLIIPLNLTPTEITKEYLTQIEKMALEVPEEIFQKDDVKKVVEFYEKIRSPFQKFIQSQEAFAAQLKDRVDGSTLKLERTDSRPKNSGPSLEDFIELHTALKLYLVKNQILCQERSWERADTAQHKQMIDEIFELVPPKFSESHPEWIRIIGFWADIKEGQNLVALVCNLLRPSVQKRMGLTRDMDEKKDDGIYFVQLNNAVVCGDVDQIGSLLNSPEWHRLKSNQIDQILKNVNKGSLAALFSSKVLTPILLRAFNLYLRQQKLDLVQMLFDSNAFSNLQVNDLLDLQNLFNSQNQDYFSELVQQRLQNILTI